MRPAATIANCLGTSPLRFHVRPANQLTVEGVALCNIKIDDPCVRLSRFSGFKKWNSLRKKNKVYQRQWTANVGKRDKAQNSVTFFSSSTYRVCYKLLRVLVSWVERGKKKKKYTLWDLCPALSVYLWRGSWILESCRKNGWEEGRPLRETLQLPASCMKLHV